MFFLKLQDLLSDYSNILNDQIIVTHYIPENRDTHAFTVPTFFLSYSDLFIIPVHSRGCAVMWHKLQISAHFEFHFFNFVFLFQKSEQLHA